MANYRQIHCRMWSSDNWFIELKPDLKLLFIYLFSNERATMCGLYELPLRIISFETGLDREAVTRGLEVFNKADKVKYDFETGVVWVKNAMKYQSQANPSDKVFARIKADIVAVPDCALKRECMDTLSIPYGDGKDTSVSVSSLYSGEEEGVGGETRIPETMREAAEHPDIQLFQIVTGGTVEKGHIVGGVFPGERYYRPIIEVMQHLRRKHGEGLLEYLEPFWIAWSTRKTKDRRLYSKTNPTWLIEWAFQGEIPTANGSEPTWSPVPSVEQTRKMLEEKENITRRASKPVSIKAVAGKMATK